jgi:hypothetical protein
VPLRHAPLFLAACLALTPCCRAHAAPAPARGDTVPAAIRPAPTDRHGDPLPPGALARFGTIRYRPASSELAITPDGRTVITCGHGGRVLRFYDAATGKLRRTLEVPGPWGSEPILSPDGRFVAILKGCDMTLWETAGGRPVHPSAQGMDGPVVAAGFSADGRVLAVVNNSMTCQLLDLETGKVRLLCTLDGAVARLAFSPDGKRLVLVMFDRTIRCLETGAGKELWRARAEYPRSLAFSAGGRVLALAELAGGVRLRLLDAATGKPLAPDRFPPVGKFCVDCAMAGDTLALLLPKRTLLWDLQASKTRGSLEGVGWQDGTASRLASRRTARRSSPWVTCSSAGTRPRASRSTPTRAGWATPAPSWPSPARPTASGWPRRPGRGC